MHEEYKKLDMRFEKLIIEHNEQQQVNIMYIYS